ncbi:MAG: polysaccharide deacetylase family protein [Mariprofundales bacterium]|nr:polysaccharide deacetylase family protein [Mariprofundales bacterium]
MKNIRAIMYNNVGDYPTAAMEDGMLPQAFARDMAWLSENRYRVVSLSDAMAMAEGSTPLADQLLTLTFDGGYRDASEYVAPILSKLGFPATFFVALPDLGSSLTVGGMASPCMDIDGARGLIASGFSLGAYLLGGRIYHETMQDDLIREIDEAVSFFSSQLQVPLEYVSVREGIPGKAVRTVLQSHGIKGFLTKCPTKQRPHPYCIGRIQIDDDDPNIFRVKISKNYLRFKDSRIWPYMRKYRLDRLAHRISDTINARRDGA